MNARLSAGFIYGKSCLTPQQVIGALWQTWCVSVTEDCANLSQEPLGHCYCPLFTNT